jgi:hypothetical protein
VATLTETASIGPAEQGKASLPPLNAMHIQLSARLILTVFVTQSEYQTMLDLQSERVCDYGLSKGLLTRRGRFSRGTAQRRSQIATTLLDLVAALGVSCCAQAELCGFFLEILRRSSCPSLLMLYFMPE